MLESIACVLFSRALCVWRTLLRQVVKHTAIRPALMMSCVGPVCAVVEHTSSVRGRNGTHHACDRSVCTMESSDCLPTPHLAIDLPPGNGHRSSLSASRNQRMACRAPPWNQRRTPRESSCADQTASWLEQAGYRHRATGELPCRRHGVQHDLTTELASFFTKHKAA